MADRSEPSTTDTPPSSANPATNPVDRYFGITAQGSSFRTEAIAGATTFLAMAYIVFVNPGILGATGIDTGAVFVATCLAAAIGTLIMGAWANLPIAQAPGMGLNAFFAFTVVIGMGIPWETALAATFVSGALFFVLAITGVRELIIDAIPLPLKLAVGAGIGLFIAFIGLKNAGIIVADEATLVALGEVIEPGPLLAAFGIVVTALLLLRGLKAAVFLGIVITAVAGVVFQVNAAPSAVVGAVPSVAPTFGQAFANLPELLTAQMALVVFTMLFVDFFDTAGTLIAVTKQAGLLSDEGKLPRGNRALVSDSIATMSGAALGTSTTTSYIESSAGVGAGGRTGFASVVTSGLFVLALFFSPLLAVITDEVTAPALVIVGVMMARSLGDIDWEDMTVAIPAFVTVIAMPLTFSIATGIALGLLLFPLMMIFKGRAKDLHPLSYVLFLAVLVYFVFLLE